MSCQAARNLAVYLAGVSEEGSNPGGFGSQRVESSGASMPLILSEIKVLIAYIQALLGKISQLNGG